MINAMRKKKLAGLGYALPIRIWIIEQSVHVFGSTYIGLSSHPKINA